MNPLKQAIAVWCSTYPRRVTIQQVYAMNDDEVLEAIQQVNGESPGYVSVYGFPYGHPKRQKVPAIDTMFIDFDIPRNGLYRGENIGNRAAWEHDMTALLRRIRAVAKSLIALDKEHYWRGALSGHKGVHLYLDFEPIDPMNGTFDQFKHGLGSFAESMLSELERQTGLDLEPWADVTSADLARLTRLPNTIHEAATAAFREERYCVPVSIEELSRITPQRYAELTSEPRLVPAAALRCPSQKASEVLTQYVRHSTTRQVMRGGVRKSRISLKDYDEHANHDIELEDLPFIFKWKKCLWYFRERDDLWDHGIESHLMELAAITELVNHNVPVGVIEEFLNVNDDYDEHFTRDQIRKAVQYDLHPFHHETIEESCPTFMDPRCPMCAGSPSVADSPSILI